MYNTIHVLTNSERVSCRAHQEKSAAWLIFVCAAHLWWKISLCPLVTFHFTAIYHLLYVWQPAWQILDPTHITENPHRDLCWTKYHLHHFKFYSAGAGWRGFHQCFFAALLGSGLCHDIGWPFGFIQDFVYLWIPHKLIIIRFTSSDSFVVWYFGSVPTEHTRHAHTHSFLYRRK